MPRMPERRADSALEALLTAPRGALLDPSTPEGAAIASDPDARAGAALVVAGERALLEALHLDAPVDGARVALTRHRRRWWRPLIRLSFWGCAVPFAVGTLLMTLVGLGVLAWTHWGR